jgi:hypothetical protein
MQEITYCHCYLRLIQRIEQLVEVSAIVSIPVDPPDEKIIMAEILRRISIERISQNCYLHLNIRHDLVKKSLNI